MALTFYPGVTSEADARPVEVAAGQEVAGVDIRMQKARVYRIRGKVVGAADAAKNLLRVILLPRERVGLMGGGGMIKPDGSFEIGGVQPGSYYVGVLRMEPRQGLAGRIAVDVTREDIDNVAIPLTPGVTLNGRVRIESDVAQLEAAQGKKIALDALRVQLVPVDGIAFSMLSATPKQDGSFAIEHVDPQNYRVQVFNMPDGLWIKSIRAGDRDVLEDGLDLSAGAGGDLEMVLATGAGVLTGVVVDAQQQPVAGAIVTTAPDPLKEGRDDLYRMTPTNQNGQFTLQNLAPGEYKLFAWEELEPGEQMDPDILRKHDRDAKKVSAGANTGQQVSLRIIEPDSAAQ